MNERVAMNERESGNVHLRMDYLCNGSNRNTITCKLIYSIVLLCNWGSIVFM